MARKRCYYYLYFPNSVPYVAYLDFASGEGNRYPIPPARHLVKATRSVCQSKGGLGKLKKNFQYDIPVLLKFRNDAAVTTEHAKKAKKKKKKKHENFHTFVPYIQVIFCNPKIMMVMSLCTYMLNSVL